MLRDLNKENILKKQDASQEQIRYSFTYDSHLGKLFWENPIKGKEFLLGNPVGGEGGSVNTQGYAQGQCYGRLHVIHRLVWIYHFGQIPCGFQVDHIDRNKLNNKIENLRLASCQENNRNKMKMEDKTSIFVGVCWNKGRNNWKASGRNESGVHTHIGVFKCEIEAARASEAFQRRVKKEFFNESTSVDFILKQQKEME